MAGDEKRRHRRFKLDREVMCYLDGSRVDARSEDVSAGGMFLKVEGDFPAAGTIVGLVFVDPGARGSVAFLFGRVVRTQETPVRGVGLCWEKAVSAGPPEVLATFLEGFLGIAGAAATALPGGGDNHMKSVYHFPGGSPARTAPPAAAPAPPAGRRRPGAVGGASWRPPQPDVPAPPPSRVLHVPAPATGAPSGPRSGFLTQLTEVSALQAPAGIDADLRIQGSTVPVRISRLGLAGMFVETPVMPIDASQRVSVRFTAAWADCSSTVVCECEVQGVSRDAPGLHLRIVCADEGAVEGSLRHLARSLHQRALERS